MGKDLEGNSHLIKVLSQDLHEGNEEDQEKTSTVACVLLYSNRTPPKYKSVELLLNQPVQYDRHGILKGIYSLFPGTARALECKNKL
jgi:hypothetical protein